MLTHELRECKGENRLATSQARANTRHGCNLSPPDRLVPIRSCCARLKHVAVFISVLDDFCHPDACSVVVFILSTPSKGSSPLLLSPFCLLRLCFPGSSLPPLSCILLSLEAQHSTPTVASPLLALIRRSSTLDLDALSIHAFYRLIDSYHSAPRWPPTLPHEHPPSLLILSRPPNHLLISIGHPNEPEVHPPRKSSSHPHLPPPHLPLHIGLAARCQVEHFATSRRYIRRKSEPLPHHGKVYLGHNTWQKPRLRIDGEKCRFHW